MQILRPKVLVAGAHGLLGSKLVALLKDKYEVYAFDLRRHPEAEISGVQYLVADLTNQAQMTEIMRQISPKYIFNAAAYTNVDRCEIDKEICWKVNAEGVGYLAHAARLVGSRVIHVSTDYVFDGKKGPYRESDRPNPLGYYGKSKLAGENALIASGANFAIARTMVLYGYAPLAPPNFVTWVIQQLRQGKGIRIVDDQLGNPTLADELAVALIQLAESDRQEVYHICGSELIDRYHFALQIAACFDLDAGLIARITTAELNQKAPRPLKSGFYIDKAREELGVEMSDVKGALEKFRTAYNPVLNASGAEIERSA
ncbi:MAG: dTDP-4-dehydrorhamnose reductase [Calditrichaeota bacterium]|nr:MAG: dTDP-4-dehydrorhamnose reductase [Calditrichota bacterium]